MDAFSVFLTIWRIAGLWAAALVFALPLRRPAGPRAWMLPGIAACIAVRAALWLMLAGFPARLWLYDIASYLLVAAAVALCTDISRAAVLYAAVWAMVLYYVGDSLAMTAAHAASGAGGGPLPMTLAALAAAAALYLAVGATLARFMPVDRSYQVGPRQMTSAYVLLVLVLVLVQFSYGSWYREDD